MRNLSSEAVMLSTGDLGETDRLVSVYTKDFGRIKAVAKGAKKSRKRFGSALEPFTHIELFFTDRENSTLARLDNCRIITTYPEIASNIKTVAYGSYLIELVNIFTPERQKNIQIFYLLNHFIGLLSAGGFREGMLRLFEHRFFMLTGYMPQFLQCVACGKGFNLATTYMFSVNKGGIVCSSCRGGVHGLIPLSNGTIRLFQKAREFGISKLNRLFFTRTEQEESRVIFSRFMEFHMGKRPRSIEIIKQIENIDTPPCQRRNNH